MAFYTVMIPPPGSGGARDEVERARLLPDAFSWPAFFFGGLWLLGRRLWLASLVLALVWTGLVYAAARLGLGTGTLFFAHLLIGLFLGLEGQALTARKLARRGWRLVDVVEAGSLAGAERRFFERALGELPALPRPAAPARPLPSGPVPVIGLFPEARGR